MTYSTDSAEFLRGVEFMRKEALRMCEEVRQTTCIITGRDIAYVNGRNDSVVLCYGAIDGYEYPHQPLPPPQPATSKLSDAEIRAKWNEAVRLSNSTGSPFRQRIRMAMAERITDELEATGVTPEDLDRCCG